MFVTETLVEPCTNRWWHLNRMKNDGNSTTDLSTQSGFFVSANALRCSREGASDAVGERGDDPGGQRRQSMPLLLPATKTKIGDLLIDVSNFPSIRLLAGSEPCKRSSCLIKCSTA
ncbi:hypothetical protein DAI22_02g168600 [Oryza sativa Japonica Group]|nr:hypothetical protein DAI22_02g168600 [Oryza sativa Japonica Group]KAF2944796.1 hypothetical protein DAI22_02g168600 [Oryza sativa Japonica Group]